METGILTTSPNSLHVLSYTRLNPLLSFNSSFLKLVWFHSITSDIVATFNSRKDCFSVIDFLYIICLILMHQISVWVGK